MFCAVYSFEIMKTKKMQLRVMALTLQKMLSSSPLDGIVTTSPAYCCRVKIICTNCSDRIGSFCISVLSEIDVNQRNSIRLYHILPDNELIWYAVCL